MHSAVWQHQSRLVTGDSQSSYMHPLCFHSAKSSTKLTGFVTCTCMRAAGEMLVVHWVTLSWLAVAALHCDLAAVGWGHAQFVAASCQTRCGPGCCPQAHSSTASTKLVLRAVLPVVTTQAGRLRSRHALLHWLSLLSGTDTNNFAAPSAPPAECIACCAADLVETTHCARAAAKRQQ